VQRKLGKGSRCSCAARWCPATCRAARRRGWCAFALWLGSLVIVVGGWWLALKVLNVSSYFARSPADVWRFLFVDDGEHGAARSALFHALAHTLPAA